MKQSWCI